MKNLRFILAASATKITLFVLKIITRSSGTSFPGKIASLICPNFLKLSNDYIKDKIFTVTGTNGKTTTCGILASILKIDGRNVVHNEKGANMPNGILTAIGTQINKNTDDMVLECDEAYLKQLYEGINPDYLIVTNFFRDQLDRYGELDATQKKVNTAIELKPDLKLILNADDPLVYKLSKGRNAVFYGIEDVEYKTLSSKAQSPAESVNCSCGLPYNYSKRFYAHLGHWFCDCGYSRPEIQIKASVKLFFDYSYIDISYKEKTYRLKVNLPGLYNVYNVLAAVSAALENNVALRSIDKAVENYKAVFGRSENFSFDGKKAVIQLIKNPTGATEVLKTVSAQENSNLLVAINDDYADGRDISWLWDANFELLQNFEGEIFVSGKRAYDMALRLKYAYLDTSKITVIPNLKKALNRAVLQIQEGQKLIILPTYTALLNMQKMLKKYKK